MKWPTVGWRPTAADSTRPRTRTAALSQARTKGRLGALIGGLVMATGCALPRGDDAGIEVQWALREHPGSLAPRERTCAGLDVMTIAVGVADLDDEDRDHVFSFPCADGWTSEGAPRTSPSAAFVSLRPGRYTVSARALSRTGSGDWRALEVEDDELVLDDDEVTWALAFQASTHTLMIELEGQTGCSQVRTWLYYGDPLVDLVRDPADGDPLNVRYRGVTQASVEAGLGLVLDGSPIACSDLVDSLHRFDKFDRGRYTLDVEVDGGPRCRMPLAVGEDGAPTSWLSLDLSDPPC